MRYSIWAKKAYGLMPLYLTGSFRALRETLFGCVFEGWLEESCKQKHYINPKELDIPLYQSYPGLAVKLIILNNI